MASRVPDSVIAEVRERTDIVRLVEQYVTLKRSGANFLGLCPFHEEKTPSFVVSPQRRTFYCFGCHERGDVFEFVRKIEGKSFPEVLEELARQAGVELPRVSVSPGQLAERQRRRGEREKSLKLNELAVQFFVRELAGSRGQSAREYLRSRGVGEEVAGLFRLGYAPDAWDGLTAYLAQKKVPAYLAVNLGLVARSRRGAGPPDETAGGGNVAAATHYDFFRDRLMFPVLGPGGEALAFSGRMLDPQAAERKYVNSPESPVYHKAEALYGIHVARRAMRKTGRAMLVEGNLDVVAMHQAGFDNVVAPLGTALTRSQVNLLRRFASAVVVLFDGDDAGREAADKAANLLLEMEFEGWVATLPDGYDPDSLVREQGPPAVEAVVAAAVPAADHLIQKAARRAGSEIPGRVKALEALVPVLRSIRNPVSQALYVEKVAAVLAMDREMVDRALKGGRADARASTEGQPGRRAGRVEQEGRAGAYAADDPQVRHVLALLALLTVHPHLAPAAAEQDVVSFIPHESLQRAVVHALDLQAETGRVDAFDLLNRVDADLTDIVAEAVLAERYAADLDAHRALNDIVNGLKLTQLNAELKDLGLRIERAERDGDQDLLRELALRRHELSYTRNHLIGERA